MKTQYVFSSEPQLAMATPRSRYSGAGRQYDGNLLPPRGAMATQYVFSSEPQLAMATPRSRYSGAAHPHAEISLFLPTATSDDDLRARFDCRENRPLPDAAFAARFGGAPLDADVALLSEGGAPGVFDLPIFLAVVGAVANNENAVVQVLSASLVREHTLGVVLEYLLVSLDGHRDGLLSDGGLECALCLVHVRVTRHIANSQHFTTTCWARRGPALRGGLVCTLVRIVCLRHEAILGDPIEGLVHRAALAFVATLVAVEDVLLGQAHELP